jgi:hypothetical protein
MRMMLRQTMTALLSLLSSLGCNSGLDASLATQYELRTLAGRPLPSAFISWEEWPPADSQFVAITASRIEFLSDSTLHFEVRQESVQLHSDGSITSLGTGTCWSGDNYRYARAGDHYAITALPGPTDVPPAPTEFRVGPSTLTAFTFIGDTVYQWGYQESDADGSVCDEF